MAIIIAGIVGTPVDTIRQMRKADYLWKAIGLKNDSEVGWLFTSDTQHRDSRLEPSSPSGGSFRQNQIVVVPHR